jgi:hypothetical protein
MSALLRNVYGPEQMTALQFVFDRTWLQLSDAYIISKSDLAALIFALAADGGSEDSEEIDSVLLEAEVLANVGRIRQRAKRPSYAEKRPWGIAALV